MAEIKNNWQKFEFPADDALKWVSVKSWLGNIESELPKSAVYVIRLKRPFTIAYPKAPSPVLYIGEGDFKARFRSHMKEWIYALAGDLPNARIEARFQKIAVRNNSNAYKEVEADLLYEFGFRFGITPLMNRQYETNNKNHSYDSGFFDVLLPGKGRGYNWALTPLRSNRHYASFEKGGFF